MAVSTGPPRPPPKGRESGRALPKLILAAALVGLGVLILATALSVYAIFTGTTSVTPNDFATCSQFPPEGAVSRVGSWTTGLTHTPGAGTHRLLVFAVGYEHSSDPGVSSVTYGGQSLTRITGAV